MKKQEEWYVEERKMIEQLDEFIINTDTLEGVVISHLHDDSDVRVYICDTHDEYRAIEEKMEALNEGSSFFYNILIGFYDEYAQCHNCCGAVKTTPTSAYWVADWWNSDDGFYCSTCVQEDLKEEYVEHLTNNSDNANTILSHEDLVELGWEKMTEDYIVGMNYGYRHEPKVVLEKVSEKYENVLFSITSSSPFDTEFCVYIK